VSEVGRGMSVLDGGGDRRRRREVLGVNVGHPVVTNGILCVRQRGSSQITLGFLLAGVDGRVVVLGCLSWFYGLGLAKMVSLRSLLDRPGFGVFAFSLDS